MLVIARKVGQTVLIGDEIEITISSLRGDQVRLAINAPRSISIFRKEAVQQVELGNAAAVDAAEGFSDIGFSILDFGLSADRDLSQCCNPESNNRGEPPEPA